MRSSYSMQMNNRVGGPSLRSLSIHHADLGFLKDWLGLSTDPSLGRALSLKNWWLHMTASRKAIASITLLVSWEIWNERNARVFRNKHVPSFVIFDLIKNEAKLWVTAGTKRSREIIV